MCAAMPSRGPTCTHRPHRPQAILALLVPFFVISRYGQRSEEAQELCNCECDAPSRPRDDGCLRVLQSMTSARSDHGSPAYVAPEVPHAIATLRATRQVSAGTHRTWQQSKARHTSYGRARLLSQELEYTASIIDVKPSTISPDMWGAFAKGERCPAAHACSSYRQRSSIP